MAMLDRSQKIAFIYANPLLLLKHIESQEANGTIISVSQNELLRKEMAQKVSSDALLSSLEKIKSNLSKLEVMQSKIHFMINQLEKIGKR